MTDNVIKTEVGIDYYSGNTLKEALKQTKAWGKYDLWSRSRFNGSRDWRQDSFQKTEELLVLLDIQHLSDSEKHTIKYTVQLPDKEIVDFTSYHGLEHMMVYVNFPQKCPKESLTNIALYFNYINGDMATAHFEVNEDGHMRLTTMLVYSDFIDHQVILCWYLLGMQFRILQQYGEGMTSVITGGQTPEFASQIAINSRYSNLCDWYDDDMAPVIKYHM